MENYPICETIEEYEPQFDDVNNIYRDMNNSEIKIKYGNRSFRCCGVEYTKGKKVSLLINIVKVININNF